MTEAMQHLTWDSQFFGRQVGRIEIQTSEELNRALSFSRHKGFELVYVYSPAAIEESSFNQYSLIDVGGHITFTKNIAQCQLEDTASTLGVEEYNQESITPELQELALLSGHLSRFRIDTSLPGEGFKKLYERWLANSISNRPNTTIYTYQTGRRVAGLITTSWSNQKCKIELLGVLKAYQGRGIASKLIQHVIKTCTSREATSVEVKTQLSNKAARALYLKNCFAELNRSYLYHAHLVEKGGAKSEIYQLNYNGH